MTRIQRLACVCLVVGSGGLPALSSAQASPQRFPRAVDRWELPALSPAPAQRVSPLGVAAPSAGFESERAWWLRSPARRDRARSNMAPLPTVTPSLPECSMPVARRPAETIAPMPTATVDSTGNGEAILSLPECTNPLDRLP
jgi:hypothetical protein